MDLKNLHTAQNILERSTRISPLR